MTNYERLKSMTAEEMARAIVYKGFCYGDPGAELYEHFKQETEKWVKWLNGEDPRHISYWGKV